MTCLRNNTAKLYFISGRADPHWKAPSCPRDATDIYRFPIVHMLKVCSHRAITLQSPYHWWAVPLKIKGATRQHYGDHSIIAWCEWAFKTHFLLENLSISEPSFGILQNFQHRSALPYIKYNCAVLFLRQVNYLFNYAPKTKNSIEKKFSHRFQC